MSIIGPITEHYKKVILSWIDLPAEGAPFWEAWTRALWLMICGAIENTYLLTYLHQQSSRGAELHWSVESARSTLEKKAAFSNFIIIIFHFIFLIFY